MDCDINAKYAYWQYGGSRSVPAAGEGTAAGERTKPGFPAGLRAPRQAGSAIFSRPVAMAATRASTSVSDIGVERQAVPE